MNFVFNEFKRRFLNGEVPSADTWTYIPVSDTFKAQLENNGCPLEQYRTIYDIKEVSDKKYNGALFNFTGAKTETDGLGKSTYVDITDANFKIHGTGLVDGKQLTHIWSKVIDDESFTEKPMFITEDNYEAFTTTYLNSIKDNPHIEEYLKSGFYFIRSHEELKWFANRSKTNSTIIGVIGDSIEGVIDTPIGPDEKYPFNGILDGNYFSLDITIKAKNIDNGIVGVLGPQGIVRNIKLVHTDRTKNRNSIECEMPINLNHLKKDGRDINCGILVGRNYGLVENIDARELNTFNLYGFVPSVYSVTNKSDKYAWNESTNIVRKKFDDKNENYYFSNSFCINSPGNICPYVGYFAEGKFYDDAAALCLDMSAAYFNEHAYINDKDEYFENVHYYRDDIDITGDTNGFEYNPLGLYKFVQHESYNNFNFVSNSALSSVECYIESPLYYGLDNSGYWTTRNFGPIATDTSDTSISGIQLDRSVICYNANLIKSVYQNNISSISSPAYEITRCSMRMHPNARAAYNVGVIIGANYGSAIKIDVNATVKNTSNFVGFIGGLIGKQADGYIADSNISMNNEFVYDFGTEPSLGGAVFYKQTPILPECAKKLLYNISDNNRDKPEIEKNYFSSWYDNGYTKDDYTINTAQDITNDVITYKLKPIFIVGGLIGRYVPSKHTDLNKNAFLQLYACGINNVNVVYDDNFIKDNTVLKNKENAFGAMIGKVDYDVGTNSILYEESLYCGNSNFFVKDKTGEPFKVYPMQPDYMPYTKEIEFNKYSIESIDIGKKFVGIYELKNNVLNSVVYNAYNYSADDSDINTPKKLSEQKIFDYCDYPISFESHEGGILQTHNFSQYINNSVTASYGGYAYKSMWYTSKSGIYPNYDHWHQYYNSPNVAPDFAISGYKNSDPQGTTPAGYNKRSMAIKLIKLDNCCSNVSNYIQLYDNYYNNWNVNKLPPGREDNIFVGPELYAISKWWSYYRTNTDGGCTNQFYKISADIRWDSHSATFSNYTNWFAPGLDINNINVYLMNGIQNTFDGYTTVDFNANSQVQYWYCNNEINIANNGVADHFIYLNNEKEDRTLTAFQPQEVNCLMYLINNEQYQNKEYLVYNTNRLFKKNIMSVDSNQLSTNQIDSLELPRYSIWKERNNDDTYYYYSYKNEEHEENNIKDTYVPLASSFAFNKEVHYDYYNKMGYYCDNDSTANIGKIEIGEYYTPIEIRQHINKNEDGTFETTSISSNNNFGGLLVVDSSGRNVMFYDNENSIQLTGNSIYFPCNKYTDDTINKLLLLEIN